MPPSTDQHHRRSIRLPARDYSAPGAYFVTIVTQGRACVFGKITSGSIQLSEPGLIARGCWCAIPEHFPNTELGAYVVMPNHIHGILILHDRVDRAAIQSPRYEHIIRNDDDWDRIHLYIESNAENWSQDDENSREGHARTC